MKSYVELDPSKQAQATQFSTELVEKLISAGILTSSEWRTVFEHVPRHLFAPRFRLPLSSGGGTVDGTDLSQQDTWLRAVYVDDALLTDFDEDGIVSSSCSAPSAVAAMLEALHVTDGQSVLEIGTGTGWNAALLATRLGSDAVTSIDIDPVFVGQARERLATLGLDPVLDVADGYRGYSSQAPYDRIIATSSLRQFPPAWVQQVRPNGVILADIRGSFAGGLARITCAADHSAHGQFLPDPVSFMPLRSPDHVHRNAKELGNLTGHAVSAKGHTRTTELHPNVLKEPAFAFFAQLALPGALTAPVAFEDGPRFFCLIHPDSQSWARVNLDSDSDRPVTQGGDRQLWDELEAAHTLWTILDQPSRDQFRITITPHAEQAISLPGTPHSWQLPL